MYRAENRPDRTVLEIRHLSKSFGETLFHGNGILADGSSLSKFRANVGMVFQSFNLFDNLTVLRNCEIGQMRVLGRSRSEARENAMKYLTKVDMAPYINAYPRQLSGGQKLMDLYIYLFRGTPMIVQLMVIYYGALQYFGLSMAPLFAAVRASI